MKKTTFSILTTFFLFSSVYGDDIGNFFDNQIATTYTGGGSFKGQTRGVYTLGSFRSRYENLGNFSPVHISLPKIKTGCGGIDATFGSFAYLDADYLVDKSKAIIASAPAFAFQLALSTLDKDTQSIIQELEKITQQANNFNINSCKASQQLANFASEKFFEQGVNEKVNSGQSNSTTKTRKDSSASIVSGWISSAQGVLGNDPLKTKKELEKTVMVGSLLRDSINLTDATGLDTAIFGIDPTSGEAVLEGFLRYLVGDLIGYKSGNATEFTYMVSLIEAGADNSLKEFLNGGKVKVIYVQLGADNVNSPSEKVKQFQTDGIIKVFRGKINTILTSMRTNTEITPANRTFINSLPIPIYRFLNAQALSGSTDDELLAEYLALVEVKAMLDWVIIGSVNGMRMTVKNDPIGASEQRAKIIKNALKVKKEVEGEFKTLMEQLKNKMELHKHYKSIEVTMANESSF